MPGLRRQSETDRKTPLIVTLTPVRYGAFCHKRAAAIDRRTLRGGPPLPHGGGAPGGPAVPALSRLAQTPGQTHHGSGLTPRPGDAGQAARLCRGRLRTHSCRCAALMGLAMR